MSSGMDRSSGRSRSQGGPEIQPIKVDTETSTSNNATADVVPKTSIGSKTSSRSSSSGSSSSSPTTSKPTSKPPT